jgi:hypothetical protein
MSQVGHGGDAAFNRVRINLTSLSSFYLKILM